MLFEVAVIEVPSVREQEAGIQERLVLGPVAVVAKDKDGAIAAAMRQAEGSPAAKWEPAKAEVLVRPFV